MASPNDHVYSPYGYGFHTGGSVQPVVQSSPTLSHHHRSASYQQPDFTYHHNAGSPLHPYPQNQLPQQLAVGPSTGKPMMPQTPIKKPRRRRGEAAAAAAAAAATTASAPSTPITGKPNPHAGVVIKTKFPVARIKRIMQADEDVGKVAQVTPVIVSKALELFMIALCAKASEQARCRNSKRITASHLKQAVLAEEQFDFLADIMSKVPDQPMPSENTNHNAGSDEDCAAGGGPASAKKQRKPRTRKPKEEEF